MSKSSKYTNWRKLNKLKKERKSQYVERYLQIRKQLEEQNIALANVPASEVKLKNTLSVALPGSILNTLQCQELQTYVCGQVARAVAIYKVDEVIVFDDTCTSTNNDGLQEDECSETWKNCLFLAKLLEFAECPQYLRRHLFPFTEELRYSALLNPLAAPHHLRQSDVSMIREGVVLEEVFKKDVSGEEHTFSYANIGQQQKVKLDNHYKPGTRVTVLLPEKSFESPGTVVPNTYPRQLGLYWGYRVRLAKSLSRVFSECPYKKGYNLCIGTSHKGVPISEVMFKKKKHNRTVIVFGGISGLEFALKNDNSINEKNVEQLFHNYVNTCPEQGTRTIRTEEAILISLALIIEHLKK